jgi:hypothetical protein
LLRFQDSPAYANPYAAPDLGTKTRAPLVAHTDFNPGSAYPAAPGNPNNESVYGVESKFISVKSRR